MPVEGAPDACSGSVYFELPASNPFVKGACPDRVPAPTVPLGTPSAPGTSTPRSRATIPRATIRPTPRRRVARMRMPVRCVTRETGEGMPRRGQKTAAPSAMSSEKPTPTRRTECFVGYHCTRTRHRESTQYEWPSRVRGVARRAVRARRALRAEHSARDRASSRELSDSREMRPPTRPRQELHLRCPVPDVPQPSVDVREEEVASLDESWEALSSRGERRCLRGESRCKRFDDAEPLASCVWEHGEGRCKRFDDAEPLASRVWEHGESGCKRFDDGELLASRLGEHGARRCERLHDAEPLPAAPRRLVAARAELVAHVFSRVASHDEERDDVTPIGLARFRHRAISEEDPRAGDEPADRRVGSDGGRAG
jgi:hypothetical protein